MRAALLLCALLCATLCAPLAARVLLVPRAACRLRDRAALAPARIAAHAAAAGRAPPGALHALSYDETCGARWEHSAARGALAALGGGGAVQVAGRAGGALCGALEAAARALRRPAAAACLAPRLAAAALRHLAAALRWRRAALPAAGAGACAWWREVAARALPDAPEGEADGAHHPQVVIECAPQRPTPPSPAAPAGVAVLLLRAEEEDAQDYSNNTSLVDESPYPESGADNGTRPGDATTRPGELEEPPPPRHSRDADDSGPVLLLSEAPLHARRPRPDLARLYGDLLDAIERAAAADRTRLDAGRASFYLYEAAGRAWAPVATLHVSATRSLDGDRDWTTVVTVGNASVDFESWSAARAHGGRAWPAAAWGALWPALCALAALAAAAAAARARAAHSRGRRRRRDVVLNPADFTFPAADEQQRRVGEGMETMLSCWLQQLHEFGGPELERPDLLKQPPRAPGPPSAPSSTTSVNRLAPDRRVRYMGDAVHVKRLPVTGALELRRRATDVLLLLQGLRHENINPFIGCLCTARPALVWDHCGRGSLEDVLMTDDIRLDWTFRLSLLTDLVRGLRYVHASPLRVHGRLSSRNCVVDSRWVLRLTDLGLPDLLRAQGLPPPPRTARDLLWTAPELLREGRGAGRGSQPGDVFSFAIIMQEVIVRGEPYCMLALTPDEIVEKLCRPPPLIRPSVSMGAAPPEAVSVMRQCWAEAPDLRPDCAALIDIFRLLHRGRKINIVDSMFEMLEKYSNNLEELIRERTEQLDMEKKKTEQLLNRMLPRSVAERLLLGSRVEPEEFEEVSIYFSDIVGFTALAARSTPVQVVALLNDLYTTFDAAIEQYRVYKVETIGDAYMVVGGLPARCRDHAESVATMALHLLHLAGRFRVRHLPATPLRLRIGIHSGPCCAAVVGLTMPRYCLFGDTVNTASRMESTGAAWRIQVSAATAERLQAAGGYRLRSRGLTQIKGKGVMHTYWLLGKEGFDKPLPTPPPLESEEVLFETDGENEADSPPPDPPSAAPAPPAPAPAAGDECAAGEGRAARADRYAWQRSGCVSADSSPPASRADRDPAPHYALYKSRGGAGAGSLRRQWSLERGDALAAAAGEWRDGGGAGPAAERGRYRTRPEARVLY